MKCTFKKLTTMLLALLMVVSLTACGGGSSDSEGTGDSTETTDSTAAGSATGDDTFIYAVGGEPDMMDPATVSDSVTSVILSQIYTPLFSMDEKGGLVNRACESYDVSEDGKTFTFHLIENNYWSDGQQVVAEDYVYNMKRAVGFGSEDSSNSHFITDFVVGGEPYVDKRMQTSEMTDLAITAVDDFTIEITLNTPMSFWPSVMTGTSIFYPVRRDYAKELDSEWALDASVPTNGPFHLVSFDSTTEYVMEANEYYGFKDDVKIKNLIAKIIPDQDAQKIAFETGEVDMATSLATTTAKVYEGQPELLVPPSVINYYLNINCMDEKFEDPNVRRALQLALNREDIVAVLDAGEVYYPLYGLVPLNIPGVDGGDFRGQVDAEQPYVYYDLEEAKALLTEAGYSETNKLKFEYYYNQSSFHDIVSQVMQQQWQATGMVECTLKTGELRTFFDDRGNGFFDLARNAFSADYIDVSTYLVLGNPDRMKTPTWGDQKYVEMLDAADHEFDANKRLELFHDAEQYLVEEMAYCIPVIGYSTVYLVKSDVSGIVFNPQGGYSLTSVTK